MSAIGRARRTVISLPDGPAVRDLDRDAPALAMLLSVAAHDGDEAAIVALIKSLVMVADEALGEAGQARKAATRATLRTALRRLLAETPGEREREGSA